MAFPASPPQFIGCKGSRWSFRSDILLGEIKGGANEYLDTWRNGSPKRKPASRQLPKRNPAPAFEPRPSPRHETRNRKNSFPTHNQSYRTTNPTTLALPNVPLPLRPPFVTRPGAPNSTFSIQHSALIFFFALYLGVLRFDPDSIGAHRRCLAVKSFPVPKNNKSQKIDISPPRETPPINPNVQADLKETSPHKNSQNDIASNFNLISDFPSLFSKILLHLSHPAQARQPAQSMLNIQQPAQPQPANSLPAKISPFLVRSKNRPRARQAPFFQQILFSSRACPEQGRRACPERSRRGLP
jgi:hypothetical protein